MISLLCSYCTSWSRRERGGRAGGGGGRSVDRCVLSLPLSLSPRVSSLTFPVSLQRARRIASRRVTAPRTRPRARGARLTLAPFSSIPYSSIDSSCSQSKLAQNYLSLGASRGWPTRLVAARALFRLLPRHRFLPATAGRPAQALHAATSLAPCACRGAPRRPGSPEPASASRSRRRLIAAHGTRHGHCGLAHLAGRPRSTRASLPLLSCSPPRLPPRHLVFLGRPPDLRGALEPP